METWEIKRKNWQKKLDIPLSLPSNGSPMGGTLRTDSQATILKEQVAPRADDSRFFPAGPCRDSKRHHGAYRTVVFLYVTSTICASPDPR